MLLPDRATFSVSAHGIPSPAASSLPDTPLLGTDEACVTFGAIAGAGEEAGASGLPARPVGSIDLDGPPSSVQSLRREGFLLLASFLPYRCSA